MLLAPRHGFGNRPVSGPVQNAGQGPDEIFAHQIHRTPFTADWKLASTTSSRGKLIASLRNIKETFRTASTSSMGDTGNRCRRAPSTACSGSIVTPRPRSTMASIPSAELSSMYSPGSMQARARNPSVPPESGNVAWMFNYIENPLATSFFLERKKHKNSIALIRSTG